MRPHSTGRFHDVLRGVQVDEGLVFLSDSRTNAGVDHVSTFRKMTFFEVPGERAIVLLSAGNLATSQSVTGLLLRSARPAPRPAW
jgi:putative proteasome-type protease